MKHFAIIAIVMFLIYILAVNEYIIALKIIGFGSIAVIALYFIFLILYCIKTWLTEK